jgi:ribosomal protein S12 methylthiotransferase
VSSSSQDSPASRGIQTRATPPAGQPGRARTVRLVTLGCARNEVDSEELAARLEAAGWTLVGAGGDDGDGPGDDDDSGGSGRGSHRVAHDPHDPDRDASVVLVNTCGFIEAAKQDSIGELLSAAEGGGPVVAAGCLAERYGADLAEALPEAEVISFDDYPDIGALLDQIVMGRRRPAHAPRDRRRLLPLAPAERPAAQRPMSERPADQRQDAARAGGVHVPGHGASAAPLSGSRSSSPAGSGTAAAGDRGSATRVTPGGPGADSAGICAPVGESPASAVPARVSRSGSAGLPPSGPQVLRRRLSGGLTAPLKIASGCDRRCSFCAIPSFRGAFISRRPQEILAEAGWLAGEGVRELVLVSENSTSYGKDLGNLRLLEELLPALAAVPGIARVRVSYLQPAEVRPGLTEVMATTAGVAPYFDLSFQHASGPVLRAMRRFGDRERFRGLLGQLRRLCPDAGVRSNFIVGFPGETRADLAELCSFLEDARLDAIGIFAYSDEDGTAAVSLPGKVDGDEVAARLREISDLAEELMAQRAEERIGEDVEVLIERPLPDGGFEGRAAHQAPEVDGATTVLGDLPVRPGDLVRATVLAAEGVDLIADAVEIVPGCAAGQH